MNDNNKKRKGKKTHLEKYGRLEIMLVTCPFCNHHKAWKKKGFFYICFFNMCRLCVVGCFN